MAKNFPRTGKKVRPKTAVKGKRFRCAKCRKRSPKPIKTLAPWYCPNCQKEKDSAVISESRNNVHQAMSTAEGYISGT
jgi:ribosomal protein L37AE/L43A